MLHVFREDLRRHYDIESLWADAPVVNWKKVERAVRRKAAVGE